MCRLHPRVGEPLIINSMLMFQGNVKFSFPNWLNYTLSCQPLFPLWLPGEAYKRQRAEPAQCVPKATSKELREAWPLS